MEKPQAKPSKLKRPKQPMPPDIRRALRERDLLAAYRARPDYQQNDYLGWIALAKREATRQKRIDQMLEELALGDVYMRMAWHPARSSAGATGGGRGAVRARS